MIDLNDAETVTEYTHDAAESGDQGAILRLLDHAIASTMTAQSICNVLTATLWHAQEPLHSMLGWAVFVPSDVLVSRRAQYAQLAVAWVDEHEPSRKQGLLQGLVSADALKGAG